MIFLNSASSAAALVFYLPGVCTHTDTERKQRKARVRNILKSLEKNTIFNEQPVVALLQKNQALLVCFVCCAFMQKRVEEQTQFYGVYERFQ